MDQQTTLRGIPSRRHGERPGFADDRPPCERFDWPLQIERGWLDAAPNDETANGTALGAPPDHAITLALKPAADAMLPTPPSRAPKSADTNSGYVSFNIPVAGTWQVTISGEGWLDAVVDGASVPASAHTGNRECATVRKSLRFILPIGKVILEISNASAPATRLAIRRIE